jgi:membrane-bound lytic murein transglycosylase A
LLIVDLASVIPELKGKRVRGRLEGNKVVPYFSRGETREAAGLAGQEIVWIDNALDAFMLEVQGSGRVQLTTGETIRLQYEDQNGHPYRSIGKYLADQGVMPIEQVNMPAIRAWLAANPQRLHEVLDINPSVVFFREAPLEDPSIGPKGALGVPLTAGALDRRGSEVPAAGRADVPVDDASRYDAAAAATGGRSGYGRRHSWPRARGSVLRLSARSRRSGGHDEV